MSGPPESTNPAATAMANGVLVGTRPFKNRPSNPTSKPHGDKPKLTVKVADGDLPITVRGREAQTLALLIQLGVRGFTSGEASPLNWARRTSAYVHKLNRAGVPVASVLEPTSDGARVARYSLAAPVAVVVEGEA